MIFLRLIPWLHQHLQFIEHTRFELMTLNFPLHKNEIHLWFTSYLLKSSNDTLQHRTLHNSRISDLWPVSVSLLPTSRRLRSLFKLASRSSTFILTVHFEPTLIYGMHEIFFNNLNPQFNLICKLSNLKQHIYAFTFFLIVSFDNNIHHIGQVLPNLRLCISISCLIHKNFACHFESRHKSNKS